MHAWKLMDSVLKCAKENNIPFILYTIEGNVSYHPELIESHKIDDEVIVHEDECIIKEDEPKKEHVVIFEHIARLYLYMDENKYKTVLLDGNPMKSQDVPAVYLKIPDNGAEFNIMIIYKDKSYDLFAINYYISGYHGMSIDNYKMGVMSFKILDNPWINTTDRDIEYNDRKQFNFDIRSSIRDDFHVTKDLSVYKHPGDQEEWNCIIDHIIDAIDKTCTDFYNRGVLYDRIFNDL